MASINRPVIEKFPSSYTGYDFLSLIVYNQNSYLVIIDNIIDNGIYAYVLDWCYINGIDEQLIKRLALQWRSESPNMPFSFFVSKQNQTDLLQKIYSVFSVQMTERIIGNVFEFPMTTPTKIKHKRKNKNFKQ